MILPTSRTASPPLELVHLDITGKISSPSFSGCLFAVGFVDDYTAKTDVCFKKSKSHLFLALTYYKERSMTSAREKLFHVRRDGPGENVSNAIRNFCLLHGILLEASPSYTPQSNGVADRFIQEFGTRARVFLFDTKLKNFLWAETMTHGNWLQNRLPSDRVSGQVQILLRDFCTISSFREIPVFGQHVFAFLYQPPTRANKKVSACAARGHFVGSDNDKTLDRIFYLRAKRL